MSQLRPIPTEPIEGAIALVTGAGQGIGLATALSLRAAGAKVIAGYYQRPLASLPAEIDQIRMDVTQQSAVDSAAKLIGEKYGALDILVNNAGIVAPIGRFGDLSSEDIAIAFDVNVVGTTSRGKGDAPFFETLPWRHHKRWIRCCFHTFGRVGCLLFLKGRSRHVVSRDRLGDRLIWHQNILPRYPADRHSDASENSKFRSKQN